MKYIVYSILALLTINIIACSNSPQMIDDQKMESIITQCIITNAMIDVKKIAIDTLDPYAAIFENENVTLEDVKYTISQMAARKSNPLDNMFTVIRDKVDSIASVARHKSKIKSKYDSAALEFVTDTIYFSRKMIKGDPSKTIVKSGQVKNGDYNIKFDYNSNKHYEIGVPTLKVSTVKDGTATDQTVWISRVQTETEFKHNIKVDTQKVDSIIITFTKPSITKKGKKMVDSSYVKNLKLLFIPPTKEARKVYFEHISNINTNIDYDGYEKDSLLSHFTAKTDSSKCNIRVPRLKAD